MKRVFILLIAAFVIAGGIISNLSVPIWAQKGPENSMKLRFPYFVTMMVVGCQPYAPAGFTPREILLVLISVRG